VTSTRKNNTGGTRALENRGRPICGISYNHAGSQQRSTDDIFHRRADPTRLRPFCGRISGSYRTIRPTDRRCRFVRSNSTSCDVHAHADGNRCSGTRPRPDRWRRRPRCASTWTAAYRMAPVLKPHDDPVLSLHCRRGRRSSARRGSWSRRSTRRSPRTAGSTSRGAVGMRVRAVCGLLDHRCFQLSIIVGCMRSHAHHVSRLRVWRGRGALPRSRH
jgi:hypothetical protein